GLGAGMAGPAGAVPAAVVQAQDPGVGRVRGLQSQWLTGVVVDDHDVEQLVRIALLGQRRQRAVELVLTVLGRQDHRDRYGRRPAAQLRRFATRPVLPRHRYRTPRRRTHVGLLRTLAACFA